ncbi:rhomboid family intramembrane serine protease [Fusicatenibacter sp.]
MEEQKKNSYDPNEDIVDRMWKRSKNSINLFLVISNVLVFFAVTLTGGTESTRHMIDSGAAYAPLIAEGEYYRLFTSMFLHFGIQHLTNNMLLLLFLGDYLERAVGKFRYLVIYLGGGIIGNLCSYLHELFLIKTGKAPAVSAGASGAIFAAVGAMLVLLAFRKGKLEDLTFRRMAIMAGLSLMVGFQSSNVDNFAHLGGFFAGAFLMVVLYPGMEKIRKKEKRP